MNCVPLESLISMIAKPQGLPELAGTSQYIVQSAETPRDFVAPALHPVQQEQDFRDSPAVLLITAPAAVGKSVLARYLSATTGNPYWDLGAFRVGSNFFTGTLARSYGGPGYAAMEERLRSGSVTLIVDAADEALVRAGLGNFQAAIEDLTSLLDHATREHASVVILGRPETTELTAVLLAEQGLTWRTYVIDFYDEPTARKFVAKKVASQAQGIPHEQLDEFLDDFFRSVIHAFGTNTAWDDHRAFLGYSPVLDALSAFPSNHSNPYAAFQRLKAENDPGHVWDLIASVISQVCERERDKFSNSFGGGDPRRRHIARESFTITQQVRILLAEVPEEEMIEPSSDTPNEMLDELIEAAGLQMREHALLGRSGQQANEPNPLLRFANHAFRDFVAAWALTHGAEGEARQVISYYQDPRVNPTPMLCRFLLAEPVGATGTVLRSGLVSLAIESAASDMHEVAAPSGTTRGMCLELGYLGALTTDSGDSDDRLALTVTEGDEVLGELVFQPSEGIELSRSVQHCHIDLPGMRIGLGAGMRDLALGPAVSVTCGEIVSRAEDVRIEGQHEEGGVILAAGSFSSTTMRLRVSRPDNLRVLSASLPFPWQAYGVVRHDGDRGAVYAAGMELRRLLSWFLRKSMKGRMRYPSVAMDTILSKNRAPREMFDYCMERGQITREGKEYVFHEPPPGLAVKTMDLRNKELRTFLEDYVARG